MSSNFVYRVTQGFIGLGQGWSETHYCQTTEAAPRNLLPTVIQLAQKRANMLGSPFILNKLRIAKFLVDGVRSPRGVFPYTTALIASPASTVGAAEPGDVALIVRASSLATDKTAQYWLGGPPDDAVTNGGQVLTQNANLGPALQAWTLFLTTPQTINGVATTWGWCTNPFVIDTQLVSITSNTDGTVRFTTAKVLVPPLSEDVTYRARVRKVNSGRSPLNGQLLFQPAGTTVGDSEEVIAFNQPQIGGYMKIYQAVPTFAAYSAMDLNQYVGEHKRGRPLGASRGRAPARVRG